MSDWSAAITKKSKVSSRVPGFYELSLSDRVRLIKQESGLSREEMQSIDNFDSISSSLADTFIENAVGTFSLPLGIATNFIINDNEYFIPMAVEESSVLAAASHGAKLARQGGGFHSESTSPVMTGQIQLLLHERVDYDAILQQQRLHLISYANHGQERLISRGGGVRDITWRLIPEINTLVLHVHIHTCEAMGANIVNTICEKLSRRLLALIPCEVGLQILTNLSDKRMARASCEIPATAFSCARFSGSQVVDRIVQAYQFAYYDAYRAATNNKGIMNGIDPIIIATGNDWRAVEAGAHAYACREGVYRPLALWKRSGNYLQGSLEIPMAVGTVGGVTKLHPSAITSMKILGTPTARELAEIICCAGLAQNLAALRALSTEGIQKGHMNLHQKNLQQQSGMLANTQR